LTHLLDTDVAIHLRDGNPEVVARIAALDTLPVLSLISWIELEGGVYAVPRHRTARRHALDVLTATLAIKPIDAAVVETYRAIVEAAGFSRPRILDRLIAATAIVNDLVLVTMNGEDFRDIPGLTHEVWRVTRSEGV